MHSSSIMLMLFDQETAINNRMATVDREARADQDLLRIKSLMETTNWPAGQAMSALRIPMDQQAIYAAQL